MAKETDYNTPKQKILINREIYTVQEFDKQFKRQQENVAIGKRIIKKCRDACSCSNTKVGNVLLGIFPFVLMLKNYQWKKWIYWDILSGISLGVIHIPQSMGFAVLTSLPPVFGLYSSLFPLVIYFFFGTSNHISVGTMAVISLMIGDIVERQAELYKNEHDIGITTESSMYTTLYSDAGADLTSTDATFTIADQATDSEIDIANLVDEYKVGVACAVTLTMGIVHLGMSLLRLGIVATFMSTSFIGGFYSGCAVHIATSQLKVLFGLRALPKRVGLFKVPYIWYDVLPRLPKCNIADLVISVISITFLIFFKEFLNPKLIKKIKVPVPAELLLIIIATVVSHFNGLEERFGVQILKHVPTGFPAPRIPPMEIIPSYIVESILVAFVAFAINISMAKVMAHKHGYKIDKNQELFASGMVNVVCSFFNSFGGAQAPARTLIHENIGGKTQLGSLVSSVLILLVILLLGPLFESLPSAVFASIIMVAILPLFKGYGVLKSFFIKNKSDCFTWMVTCITVVILDVIYGLIIGLCCSLFTIVLQSHLVKTSVVAPIHGEAEICVSQQKYRTANTYTMKGVRIFKFESALHFANADKYQDELYSKIGNPQELDKMDLESKHHDNIKGNGATENNITAEFPAVSENVSGNELELLSSIILDMQAVVYIDVNGLNVLKQVKDEYKRVGIDIVFANCCSRVLKKLYVSGVLNPNIEENVYVSVVDAIHAAQSSNELSHL